MSKDTSLAHRYYLHVDRVLYELQFSADFTHVIQNTLKGRRRRVKWADIELVKEEGRSNHGTVKRKVDDDDVVCDRSEKRVASDFVRKVNRCVVNSSLIIKGKSRTPAVP